MILTTLAILITVAAGAILIPLALSWQIKLLILTVVLSVAAYAVCLHGLRLLPWSLVALDVDTKNVCNLTRRDGKRLMDVQVCTDSVALPKLTVVRYQLAGAAWLPRLLSHYLVILPDAVDDDRYRQLRVWLRWGAVHKPDQQNLN